MMGGGMWGFGWVWMVVFWGATIGLIVWAVARLAPTSPSDRPGDRAREILDERYARGELDDDEYRRLRRELEK